MAKRKTKSRQAKRPAVPVPLTSSDTARLSASNRTPREINRNLVLNVIRQSDNVSRADLSRLCKLTRSTISIIVDQLIEEGWIVEGRVGYLPRGRRPTYLQLNTARSVLAIDIHPTQTTMGIADLDGRISVQQIVELPSDPKLRLKALLLAVKKIIAKNPERSFSGIGVCLPGRPDLSFEELIFAPNLPFPVRAIRERLQQATGLPVEIDNVANACAIAEVWALGPAQKRNLIVVNVSEGIGTGIFMSGQLVRGENGMAGEFGHIQLEPNGELCSCGARGCWETLASHRAGLRYFRELGGSASVKNFDGLLRLARNGDSKALAAVHRMCVELGRGMRMLVRALAPKEIVVVGDITSLWHEMAGVVLEEFGRHALNDLPSVRPVADSNVARLRGAVATVLFAHSV